LCHLTEVSRKASRSSSAVRLPEQQFGRPLADRAARRRTKTEIKPQAEYLGVDIAGPYKADAYRY